MCIRDSVRRAQLDREEAARAAEIPLPDRMVRRALERRIEPVSYTHLRAHETVLDLVCRLLLENK